MIAGAALLVALAVLLLPGRVRAAPASGAQPAAPPRAGTSAVAGRRGVLLAVLATAAGCVAGFGLEHGALATVLLCPLVAGAVRGAQRRPERPRADPALPLALDLVAAALRAGRPLPEALLLGSPAAGEDTAAALRQVAGLCRLGADPARAWSSVPRDGPLGQVAPVAVRSAASGTRLAAAFERLAAELRAERAAAAAVRAHRAGVTALAPLAACFLPSFVCLGVIPVVVGVARSSLGVLP